MDDHRAQEVRTRTEINELLDRMEALLQEIRERVEVTSDTPER